MTRTKKCKIKFSFAGWLDVAGGAAGNLLAATVCLLQTRVSGTRVRSGEESPGRVTMWSRGCLMSPHTATLSSGVNITNETVTTTAGLSRKIGLLYSTKNNPGKVHPKILCELKNI